MYNPDLSIIILNYKMDGLVRNCLKSIFDHQPNVSIEVIVVDNGSGDNCEEIVGNEFPRVKFIQNGANLGHAKGNNIGIKQARGRYLMILNPDIVFIDNPFDKIISYLDSNEKIGMATLQLLNPDRTLQPGAWRFHKLLTPLVQRSQLFKRTEWGKKASHHFEIKDWDRLSSRDVDWVQGSCLVTRREVVDKIGPFDERFFLYFTDVDWCRRCWDAGWRVHYFAHANVIHYYHRESAQDLGLKSLRNKVARIHIRDWLRYLRKYKRRLVPNIDNNL